MSGYIAYDIAVDTTDRLYVETVDEVYVYDEKGNEVCAWEIPFSLQNGSLCRGKDGKVYTLCEDEPFQTCLLCLDPDVEEQVKLVASEGLPTGAPHCYKLAKGTETDFVIWRDDGVYTFNLGDTFVHKVMKAYEAPLPWEDADFMTLEDGRMVFIKYFDALIEEGDNVEIVPISESVRICYVDCPEVESENKVVFERTNETILEQYK